jgi:hypothetical protein
MRVLKQGINIASWQWHIFRKGSSPQYRLRWGVSLPCSGWERVVPPRFNHQEACFKPLAMKLLITLAGNKYIVTHLSPYEKGVSRKLVFSLNLTVNRLESDTNRPIFYGVIDTIYKNLY